MLKLLADENFDNTIVRGLLRRRSSLDIVRVQDVNLSGKDDRPSGSQKSLIQKVKDTSP